MPASPAMALASSVLPVPGGPSSSTPCNDGRHSRLSSICRRMWLGQAVVCSAVQAWANACCRPGSKQRALGTNPKTPAHKSAPALPGGKQHAGQPGHCRKPAAHLLSLAAWQQAARRPASWIYLTDDPSISLTRTGCAPMAMYFSSPSRMSSTCEAAQQQPLG